jgi:pimeloyl-ACP methyl ester carboxylesterase
MRCTIRGLPVFYEEMGAGRPLLLLSGWALDHRYMAYHFEPVFAERAGWRRLYVDLPGTGQTPGADWLVSQDDVLALLLDVLDAIAPGERLAVAGASYGGYLARGLVARRPAALIGALFQAPDLELDRAQRQVPPHQVLVHDPTFEAALSDDERAVLRIAVVQSAHYLEGFRATVVPGLASADHAFLARLAPHYAFSFPLTPLAAPFPAPSLFLLGRQDSSVGYRDGWTLVEDFPRATFVVLDRAGHDVPLEQPAVFRALVGEWLGRVEEYAEQTARSGAMAAE